MLNDRKFPMYTHFVVLNHSVRKLAELNLREENAAGLSKCTCFKFFNARQEDGKFQ
jgi:hypothetical protein